MPSIFTRIVNGEIPAHVVAESDEHLAFLDINPVSRGHVLVIPKQEVDYIFDLSDGLYSSLMLFSKEVSQAIERCVKCERIALSVIGLEVPHAHVHLIPINHLHDASFEKPRVEMSQEELRTLAAQIMETFNKQAQ